MGKINRDLIGLIAGLFRGLTTAITIGATQKKISLSALERISANIKVLDNT